MQAPQIATIAANILYFSSPDAIDPEKSLFAHYGMSSLDFVDLAFEVRAASGKQFEPDALWPINSMMTNPALFAGGQWTESGRQALQQIFDGHAEIPASASASDLNALFSINFIEHRLHSL